MKDKQISADKIRTACDLWTRQLWPVWALEKDITSYANGGPAPTDDTAEEEIVPLGFANSYMRGEMAPLLDPLMNKPGIIDAKCITPAIRDADRTRLVETQVNEVLNEIVMEQMRPILTAAAGRATITGRAYLYRKSPNDWVIKSGRMLHPRDASTNPLDSGFREWAFPDKLDLRDVELLLKNADKNRYGWNKEGLELLKKWILASEAQKFKNGGPTGDIAPAWTENFDPGVWAGLDLESTCTADPVDVYWYFRKSGNVTKSGAYYRGREQVDLYCVSRFGSKSTVASKMVNDCNETELKIGYQDNDNWKRLEEDYKRKNYSDPEEEKKHIKNERLLFYQPDVFKSVEECLILHVDDAAISGEQKLGEIQGTGKTAMPKLAVMEALMTSLVEGVTFAAQPNFIASPGLGDEYARQLQRYGVRSNQFLPPEVKVMEKQNGMTGFGQVISAIRLMDNGITADSTAANSGNFGGSQQEFAAQAQAELANRTATAGRRLEGWLTTLDKVARLIGRTLCRHWPEMRETMPAYEDAARLRQDLTTTYKVHEDEWDAERWKFSARRLAGGMMREQAKVSALQGLQFISPIIPQSRTFFANEWLRATFGDTTAAQIMNPSEEQTRTQEDRAAMAVAAAFITGRAPQPAPGDDPTIHAGVASKTAQDHIKAAMQAGIIQPSEVAGIMAAIGYAVANLQRLDEQTMESAMTVVGQMVKMLESIKVQQPQQEGALTQKEAAELEIKNRNVSRLEADSATKRNNVQVKEMMDMTQLNLNKKSLESQDKTLATQRAQAMVSMSSEMMAADQPTVTSGTF